MRPPPAPVGPFPASPLLRHHTLRLQFVGQGSHKEYELTFSAVDATLFQVLARYGKTGAGMPQHRPPLAERAARDVAVRAFDDQLFQKLRKGYTFAPPRGLARMWTFLGIGADFRRMFVRLAARHPANAVCIAELAQEAQFAGLARLDLEPLLSATAATVRERAALLLCRFDLAAPLELPMPAPRRSASRRPR